MNTVLDIARGGGLAAFSFALISCVTTEPLRHGEMPHAGARYVAMGSSFAAGPGVSAPADTIARCGRSADNYAHQLARALALELVDVSCSGATTAHLFGPWDELPPQLDSLTSDTKLVTVTIGGNDVGYIGGLMSASCHFVGGIPPDSSISQCPQISEASERQWNDLEVSMLRLTREIRHRSPSARLIFVEYLSVLPAFGTCAETPLDEQQAAASRQVARRLAALTSKVAAEAGVDLLPTSVLSRDFNACAENPWVTGFTRSRGSEVTVPYHPNLAGMTKIAEALQLLLSQ